MTIKDFPKRLLSALRGINYKLGGTSLLEMNIPPGWNYQNYLQAYGEVGWLFGAVSLIANSVADSDWKLFARTSKAESTEIDDHPMLDLFDQINPFQTRYQFMLLAQMYLSLVGECFVVLDFNRLGVPGQMWLAPPGYMYVVPDRDNYISHYEYRRGMQVQRLEIQEVIHVMDPNPANPYRGMGAAHSIGTDLDSERYASRYQQKLFFNDARPGMALEIPGDIPPKEERDDFMKQWNSQYRGWGKAYSTAFLWGGMKINNVTMTNRDMDFKELRGATKNIILAAYHIPDSLIGASEVGSRARAEADEYIFAKYTIKPALQRFKEAFNEQLCPLFDEKLKLDFVNPVPEDRTTLVDECDRMVRAGVYTREFAQRILGHSPADMKGGVYLMSAMVIPETAKSVTRNVTESRIKSRLSEQQKEAMWRVYAAKTEGQERMFKRMLKKLFDEQEDEVIENLEEGKADFNEAQANKHFAESFKPLITNVYEAHYRDTLEGLKPENPHTEAIKQEFLDEDALEWISTRSLSMAKMVNGTTKEALREALAEGYAEGESIPQITKRIKEFYKNGYEWRAPMVARTETIAASAEGSIRGYEKLEVETLELYVSLDERACEECLGLHGNEYPVRETHGIIPVHVDCRCVWLPVV